jgi:hypothetical protein
MFVAMSVAVAVAVVVVVVVVIVIVIVIVIVEVAVIVILAVAAVAILQRKRSYFLMRSCPLTRSHVYLNHCFDLFRVCAATTAHSHTHSSISSNGRHRFISSFHPTVERCFHRFIRAGAAILVTTSRTNRKERRWLSSTLLSARSR